MSNLIDFLEQLGQDSRLRNASGVELQAVLAQAGVEPTIHAALACADRRTLESRLGAETNVCCIVYPSEEGDEDEAVPAPSIRHTA